MIGRKARKKKKEKLYLSDKQPLTVGGAIALAFSYLILIVWAFIILWPLVQMIIASLNGAMGKHIIMQRPVWIDVSNNFLLSLVHFGIF